MHTCIDLSRLATVMMFILKTARADCYSAAALGGLAPVRDRVTLGGLGMGSTDGLRLRAGALAASASVLIISFRNSAAQDDRIDITFTGPSDTASSSRSCSLASQCFPFGFQTSELIMSQRRLATVTKRDQSG